jgi:hypothetical protein
MLAPRAGEPNLDRDAVQMAELRIALSRCTGQAKSLFERVEDALFGRSQAPSNANCDCGA